MEHIAFLSPEYPLAKKPKGGLGSYLQKVSVALSQLEYDVTIITLSFRDKDTNHETIRIHEVKRFNFPYQFYRFHKIGKYISLFERISSAKRIERAVWEIQKDKPIDIIQTTSHKMPGHTLLGNGVIPVVCRISSNASLKRAANGKKSEFADHLYDWLETRQALLADAAFAPSNLIASFYSRTQAFVPKIIRTPLDRRDIELDTSLYDDKLIGKQYLLYFGTLVRLKGTELIADIISPLFRKHHDLELVFIGNDNGLLNGSSVFKYICDKNKTYRDRLFYYPKISKSQLYPIISNSLGVLMPSRVDNYPNACLEAQMMGKPVVGTYDSSIDEIIMDGKTGFLAMNDDPISLLKKTDQLLTQTPDEKLLMKKNIAESIEKIESEDRIGQLITFYQEVIRSFNSL